MQLKAMKKIINDECREIYRGKRLMQYKGDATYKINNRVG